MKCARLAFALLLLPSADPAVAEEGQLLRFKYEKGERVAYFMQVDQAIELSSNLLPVPQKMSAKIKADYYHLVLTAPTPAWRIEWGFDRFEALAASGNTPMPVPQMSALQTVKFELDVDPLGQMSNVSVRDARLSPQAAQIAEQFRQTIAQNVLVMPEQPIRPGVSWSAEKTVPISLPGLQALGMQLRTSYTLRSIEGEGERRIARIGISVKMALHEKVDQMGVPMEVDVEGTGDGTAVFLIEPGKPQSIQLKTLLNCSIKGARDQKPFSSAIKITMGVEVQRK